MKRSTGYRFYSWVIDASFVLAVLAGSFSFMNSYDYTNGPELVTTISLLMFLLSSMRRESFPKFEKGDIVVPRRQAESFEHLRVFQILEVGARKYRVLKDQQHERVYEFDDLDSDYRALSAAEIFIMELNRDA